MKEYWDELEYDDEVELSDDEWDSDEFDVLDEDGETGNDNDPDEEDEEELLTFSPALSDRQTSFRPPGETNDEDVPEIKVCDALMGSGKTQAAVRYMNENDGLYMYITPYLAETERIIKSCPERHFEAPEDCGTGKLDGLRKLLIQKKNIASTHALFRNMDMNTIGLIREGGYTLILDEVIEPFSKLMLKKKDIDFAMKEGLIESPDESGLVRCNEKKMSSFRGYGIFQTISRLCECKNLFHSRGVYLFSLFPEPVFRAFKEVFILTYMFKAQSLCHYFNFIGLPFRYIDVEEFEEKQFRFTDEPVERCYPWLREKIHIFVYTHQNKIGHQLSALSSSWYYRRGRKDDPDINTVRRNLAQTFRGIYQCKSSECLWTCFKSYTKFLGHTGYSSAFVNCTMRSSNAYRDRKYLAYLCNIYRNPYIKCFFQDKGVSIEENAYAVSEMVQWVFRSAIRDKKDIYIYVPSRRMRVLFRNWVEEMSTRPENRKTSKHYKPRETKAQREARLKRERLEKMPDFGDDDLAKKLWLSSNGSKVAVKKTRKQADQIKLAMDFYEQKEKNKKK